MLNKETRLAEAKAKRESALGGENQNPIPPNDSPQTSGIPETPLASDTYASASQGEALQGYRRKFPIPKVVFLGIIFLFLFAVATGAYFLGKNSGNQTSVQTTTPSPTPASNAADADVTANWKTYKNEGIGFAFKYPISYGDVLEDSVNFHFSKQKGLSFRTNYRHVEGRPSNLFADFYGFEYRNNEYYVEWSAVIDKMSPIKVVETVNTQAIIVDDAKRGFGNEKKEILALINLKDKKYTGLVFINGFSYYGGFVKSIPDEEFMKIIESIEVFTPY